VEAAIPAFGAYGIELEYAIVDRDTLDVAPLAANLLERVAACKHIAGVPVGWSNEIVAHVAEVKNVAPVAALDSLPGAFQEAVREANRVLAADNARLLPGGMHPWMDPAREAVVWTRSDAAIYAAYDRIFDCRRHGWANVQSMHVNLPFAGDAQFARLLEAVRLVLPLVPAIAASSPFVDGRCAPERDHRLAVYATHANAVPSMTGAIVPEPSDSRDAYQRDVLEPMYAAITPHDPQGVLRHEWLNCRGAIARFDRNAIEIRLADTQECPWADIAVAHAICAVVRMLYEERLSRAREQRSVPVRALSALLADATCRAEHAIADGAFLQSMGIHGTASCTLRDVWRRALDRLDGGHCAWRAVIDAIHDRGTLATRILAAAGPQPTRQRLAEVYRELAACLEEGRLFA
jgi:gamma-glutamyl:cysteine ligase YbdK (ATP-grasp superfamily)